MAFGRRDPTPLEKRLGYRFKRLDLLELSLTHRSWANEQGIPEHYERLEFLGDAVLGVVTAEWLYAGHPELPEGELSKHKAQLVSRHTLAQHARELDLGAALRIGVGEDRSGGRTKAVAPRRLHGGGVRRPLPRRRPRGRAQGDPPDAGDAAHERSRQAVTDAKTQLQEVAQALGWDLPEYRLTESLGPDHDKTFVVECWLAGELSGRGEGPSKKVAEQRAAAAALEKMPES